MAKLLISGSTEKVWPRETNLLHTCCMAAAALPEQFWPSKSFLFPKSKFGAREEERLFQVEWCQESIDGSTTMLPRMQLSATCV